MSVDHKLLICVPTYNEYENIGVLIDSLFETGLDVTVVVVDDGSTDGTQHIVSDYIKKLGDSKVILLTRTKKDGRGGAVWHGFKTLLSDRYQLYIEMDADLSHDPQDLLCGLPLFDNQTDLLIGARYPNGKIIGWPLRRRILSKLANCLAKFLLGGNIYDYTNGYRIYSPRAIRVILSAKPRFSGFISLSETVAICIANTLTVKAFPITFRDRSNGKSNATFAEVMASFVGIFKISFLSRTGYYKVKKPSS